MKRWYVKNEGSEYVCSLLSFAGQAKVATLKPDGTDSIRFQFMKFFDFARAKDGKMQTGWVRLPHAERKVRAKIIFK